MNESDAKAALRGMGIFAPSRSLVQNWLKAANADRLAEEQTPGVCSTQPNTSSAERGGALADNPISSPDLNAAIRALEAEGIPPTHQAVLDWLAQHKPALVASGPVEQRPSTDQNSSKEPPSPQKGVSKLARFAVPPAEGQRRRKVGRPLTIASWFPAVAETMADGTTLRTALAIYRLTLNANEMRSLYRNKTFKGLYQEARRRYLIENWGRSRPSLRPLLGRCI